MVKKREKQQQAKPPSGTALNSSHSSQQQKPSKTAGLSDVRRAKYHGQDRNKHREQDGQRHGLRGSTLAPQQAQGIPKKMHQQQRASLQDRMTRGDQVRLEPQQQNCESQAVCAAQAGKRKRAETDDGEQQQKKTRTDIDSTSTCTTDMAPIVADGQADVFEDIVQSATHLKTLRHLSDVQKMENRRNRFASAPVARGVLGASKITKSNGSSIAPTLRPHGERKTHILLESAVDQNVASGNVPAATGDSDRGNQNQSLVTITEAQTTKNNGGGQESDKRSLVTGANPTIHKTPSKGVLLQMAADDENRADSVIQSPVVYNAESPQSCVSTTCEPAMQKLEKPRVIISNARKPIVEPNPEYSFEFHPYDFAVLLMASYEIAHDEEAEESVDRWNDSNPILNLEAMDMYKRAWKSEDFGRGPVSKALPARVVKDCDLYFRDDQRIYVATEMGLMLVADYCKLIGMPNNQAIRFEGRKPKWAKKLEAERHKRRATESFDPEELCLNNELPLIALTAGSTVEIYERILEEDESGNVRDIAYGMRMDDSVKGFFDYECTCRLGAGPDPEDREKRQLSPPNITDWSKFDYGPGARNARQYLADLAAGKYAKPRFTLSTTISQAKTATTVTAKVAGAGTNNATTKTTDAAKVSAAVSKTATSAGPAAVVTATSAVAVSKISNAISNQSDCDQSVSPPNFVKALSVNPSKVTVTADVAPADLPKPLEPKLSVVGNKEPLSVKDANDEVQSQLTPRSPSLYRDSEDIDSDSGHTVGNSSNALEETGEIEEPVAKWVTPPCVTTVGTTVGTIRRRIGAGEYVEDEIDYDDDDL